MTAERPSARRSPGRRGASRIALLAFAVTVSGCATAAVRVDHRPIAIATPADRIPVRSPDVFDASGEGRPVEATRDAAMAQLRDELAASLAGRGFEVVDLPGTVPGPGPEALRRLAEQGKEAGASEVVVADLLVYGDFRKSWIWLLGAQALAAGIAHGIVVAAATGSSTAGWWAGTAEFLLESAVWVGGAVFGSRGFDPVLIRARLVRTSDGTVEKRWIVAGTRSWKRWFRKRGEAPRAERLLAVARSIFDRLAGKVAKRLGGRRSVRGSPPVGSRSPVAVPSSS